MVTEVIDVTIPQPLEAGTVYVTVYVPAVLVEGVMAPVEASIVKPVVEVNVPPV